MSTGLAGVVIDASLAGVTGLFTTREGGVSLDPYRDLNLGGHVGDDAAAVATNRARLADALGSVPVASVDQVHGTAVAVVTAADTTTDRPLAIADAMVSSDSGVALAILVADCLPVLLVDNRNGVIGAAHAGRVGLAAGVLGTTVAAMVELGADPADISAMIGPSICGRCYEVPAELRDEIASIVPGSAATTRDGTPSLDLPAGAVGILAGLGLGAVRRTDICTMEDRRFFSHRRDGVTGRFAGVVMLGS